MKHTLQQGTNNAILRSKSTEITEFGKHLKALEKDMKKIMTTNKGVGIAAPQVGENVRMILCKHDAEKGAITMCNPVILSHSLTSNISEEGCLSLPDLWGDVQRFDSVTLQYQNIFGKEIRLELNDFAARVVQHEIDHLDGILFEDKIIHEGVAL